MTKENAQRGTVHPIVRLNFIVRLIGCPMTALIVAFARRNTGDAVPLGLLVGLALYALVWPHVAFFFARRGRFRAREERFLVLDAGVAGVAIALTSFQTVPTLALATGYASLLASVGGIRMLLSGLAILFAAAAVTGWLDGGAATMMDAPPVASTTIAGLALLGFQMMMGLLTYRTARNFVKSRRQIAEQAEEIQRQHTVVVEAREEALQAARAKAAFLATMSHEIRTPLNGVLSMTRLLTETPLADEQRNLVHTIQVSGGTLLTVINDILDYSRIESGRMELEREPLRVREIVEDALEIVSSRAREKGVELVYEVAADVPPVILGDETRLRQVLTNLLGNAVKFTETGEIVVAVEQCRPQTDEAPAELAFSVRDSGIGIPADRIPALFTAFSQADASTTRKYGGTGLGLAISKRLVTLMGGTISAESVVGDGSTFRFTIEARASADAPTRRSERRGHHRGRVLVVDDNATGRRVLCAQLEAWGFETRDKGGATEALEELAGEPALDLAILDLVMPDVDGFALARAICELPRYRNLPLVLLSPSLVQAADDPEQLFAARVMKPVRQSQLFDAIMEAIGVGPATQVIALAGPSPNLLAKRAPLNILVADDNETNRQVAGLVLRRFGYDIALAHNGREAVERVVERAARGVSGGAEPFDLVLMDVHMPEMDGLAATRAIREHAAERPEQPWPRVVAMTADAMPEDRQTCLDAGMDGYVTKPLDFEAVQRVLEQTAEALGTASRPVTAGIVDEAEIPPTLPPLAEAPEQVMAERVMANPVMAKRMMDWSRLDQLREYDTPDGAVVRAAITSFVAQAPEKLTEVRSCAEQRDGPALRRSAHALKGAATNIGAVAVGAYASQLEEAGRDESFDEVAPLVDDLSMALVHTLAKLYPGARGTPEAR